MATYAELFDLRNNSDFRNKVAVAVMISAQAVFEEVTPTATRLQWAKDVLEDGDASVGGAFKFIISDNAGLTVGVITGAADSAIQTNVNTWRDVIYP